MSVTRQNETLAAFELALAVYRQPAMHAELLRGDGVLPTGLAALLRLAGGTDLQEIDRSLTALAPENDLRKAALFFVEEVLFQREASSYRVLGLNRDATAEQIKEHHRLLMRMFHPDRNTHSDERREHFATRANLAYNTLRDAESRSRYDEILKPQLAARAHAPRHVQPMPRRAVREPDSYWAVHVYPRLMRHLPQWVLAGTALVSVTLVATVYLGNRPLNMPQTGEAADSEYLAVNPHSQPVQAIPQAEPVTGKAAEDTAATDETAARFESRLADARQAATAVEKPVVAVPPTPPAAPPRSAQPNTGNAAAMPKPAPAPSPPTAAIATRPLVAAAPSLSAPSSSPAALLPRQAAPATAPSTQPGGRNVSAKPKPAQNLPPSATPKPVTPLALADTPAAAPKVSPVQVPPAVPVAIQPAPVETARAHAAAAPAEAPRAELPDPNSLLTKFLEAYEKGDMQTCMALLDDSMRAKQELRREYDALFRNTDLRHVKILNMNWSREGDAIRGEGLYRATMMRKGETILRSQGGQIRVELVRRGGTALINELQYIASTRS